MLHLNTPSKINCATMGQDEMLTIFPKNPTTYLAAFFNVPKEFQSMWIAIFPAQLKYKIGMDQKHYKSSSYFGWSNTKITENGKGIFVFSEENFPSTPGPYECRLFHGTDLLTSVPFVIKGKIRTSSSS